MSDYCPTCGAMAVLQCRCCLGDMKCKNGHEWHTCPVHGKVQCAATHGVLSALGCSCTKPPKSIQMTRERE